MGSGPTGATGHYEADHDGKGLRVLVTNDDGLGSAGVHALAGAAAEAGALVTLAAPSWDASGTGASLAAVAEGGRALVDQVPTSKPWAEFEVHGPPAFIVRAAVYGAFGPTPDVVLSGINRGRNTGLAIIHSGTVGAALTAATYGRRGMAISADVGEPEDWEPACAIVGRAIEWLMRTPGGTVLNVNVPEPGREGLRGVRATTLAQAGVVQGVVTERDGHQVAVTFTEHEPGLEPGTDAAALADGYVSVTTVRPVCDDDRFELALLLV